MRASIERSLAGLLIVGALAFSAGGAEAMGGSNSANAFIGIIGGNPGYYLGGGSYQFGPFNPGDARRNGHGDNDGYRAYDGGYYRSH